MEFYLIPILSLCILCLSIILLFRKNKKYNELKNLQDTEIRKRFEQEFNDEVKKRKEGINRLEKEKTQIQREIDEKRQFNNSLFKVREEELNRLIEEKRKEKEKAMLLMLEKEQKEKIDYYNKEAEQFLTEQILMKAKYKAQVDEVKRELDEFSEKRAAINEAIRRERELEEAEDFYRIVVPPDDQEDIEVLNTIAPRLRNKEALNKLIYSVFIQRPMDEMIKRVTGGRDVSGIYKITYLKTGEAYIGKTTNIKKRWGEHCKSALDIGTIAHSSFHNRLKKDGLWNYTFEILEEVPKEQLTEREKFYIQLYGTDTQLNMKVG